LSVLFFLGEFSDEGLVLLRTCRLSPLLAFNPLLLSLFRFAFFRVINFDFPIVLGKKILFFCTVSPPSPLPASDTKRLYAGSFPPPLFFGKFSP